MRAVSTPALRRPRSLATSLALPLALALSAAACQVPPGEEPVETEGEALGGRSPMTQPERPGSLPNLPVTPMPPSQPLPPLVPPTKPTPPPQGNYPEQLQWRISQPLKDHGCAYDGDSDCLNDNAERELAEAMNPMQFWDSQENCPDRKNYYQVRPVGRTNWVFPTVRPKHDDVEAWLPDGGLYYVAVNYMMMFFKDCNTKIGFINAGHQGDGEQVVFLMSSTDLQTWRLEQGFYPAHGEDAWHDRAYLLRIANDLRSSDVLKRSVRPWVATDEDGHGSYAGIAANSSSCWTGDDTTGKRDCFRDNMITDFHYGQHNPVLSAGELSNNVGEPGAWNQRIIKTSGTDAWIDHNGQREILSDPNKPFCGWTCSERNAEGNCLVRTGNGIQPAKCTSPLYRSILRTCYRIGARSYGAC